MEIKTTSELTECYDCSYMSAPPRPLSAVSSSHSVEPLVLSWRAALLHTALFTALHVCNSRARLQCGDSTDSPLHCSPTLTQLKPQTKRHRHRHTHRLRRFNSTGGGMNAQLNGRQQKRARLWFPAPRVGDSRRTQAACRRQEAGASPLNHRPHTAVGGSVDSDSASVVGATAGGRGW